MHVTPYWSAFRSTYIVRRLQSVSNAAARLIYNMRSTDHINDALVSLHWLYASHSGLNTKSPC